VENSVGKTNSRIDLIDEEVIVVSGEEEDGYEKCMKVCAGTTTRNKSKWNEGAEGNGHIYMDVYMKHCGFMRIPTITTSIEGSSNHYITLGTSSIYNAGTAKFRIHLVNKEKGVTKEKARSWNWNVDWIAVGPTC